MTEPHTLYLNELVNNIHLIGLDIKDIRTIIREPYFYKHNSRSQESLCDLLIIPDDDFSAIPVELKGSLGKYHKAVLQLNQGRIYCEEILHRQANYGLFVVYHIGKYDYREVRY